MNCHLCVIWIDEAATMIRWMYFHHEGKDE